MKDQIQISVILSGSFLALVLLMALLADFIANDQPIVTFDDSGMTFFDSPRTNTSSATVIFPPIASKGGLDIENTMVKPFRSSNHLLGTDHLGRDVLASIVHGSRTSVGISFVAICIACVIGVLMGGFSGFTGDRGFKISSVNLIYTVLVIAIVLFLLQQTGVQWFAFLFFLSVLTLIRVGIGRAIRPSQITIPVDLLVLKFLEIFSAVPTYFLLLALVAFIQPNWLWFALLIGITSWVGIAKLVRAEMIKVRSMGFIQSAEALGTSNNRIFFKHALPNAVGPIPYAFTFGIASIIAMESTLSYFGVGLPPDSLSWGNALSGFKNNSTAWWVALFPGIMIFTTILSLHVVGRWLDARFNPREETT